MEYLIKETVDAVRLAEKDAEAIIETAKANANDKKAQINDEAKAYREEVLKKAQKEAEVLMENIICDGEKYNNDKKKAIEQKIEGLKSEATKNFDKAVDAIINALV